jgi:PPK2 family polyphosphate:nucleotide phosphotransferase
MKLDDDLVAELLVVPGERARLQERSTSDTETPWLETSENVSRKELADRDLESFRTELKSAQEVLYASREYALLVIIQGLDAAGKDGTISHVMSGVNPQGCGVASFKEPTPEELSHDFLWRCVKALPERGNIEIFNRSYYEEVLVVRVHENLLAQERLAPDSVTGEALWKQRYEQINAFERHLHLSGTRIVKFFLHVSKQEQTKRLLARLNDPTKYWKFSSSDLKERSFFGDYMQAYEDALTATSTEWAPWYVIPADHKFMLRALVGGILIRTMDRLHLAIPKPSPALEKEIQAAKRAILSESAS